MNPLRTFLIVEDNREASYLLHKTLLRKFPEATIHLEADSDAAVSFVRETTLDAIIVHRAWNADAVTLVAELRALRPTVPIVAVSGVDRAKATLAAGANRFLNYDEWLRIGSLVAEVLGVSKGDTPFPQFPTRISGQGEVRG